MTDTLKPDEMRELLPCPFCGGEAETRPQGNELTKKGLRYTIRCKECRIERTNATLRHGMDWLEKLSVEQWNHRAAPAVSPVAISDLQRYTMDSKGLPFFDDTGVWVLFQDVAMQQSISPVAVADATLSCPFCKSEDISDGEILTQGLLSVRYVQSECQNCGAIGPKAYLGATEIDYGDDKARNAWNMRPAAQQSVSPVAVAIVRHLETAFVDGKRAMAFLSDESLPDGTKLGVITDTAQSISPVAASTPIQRCAASSDGECSHLRCSQIRDGEPYRTGRHCPIDIHDED